MPPRRPLWLRAPRAPGSPGVVPAVFPATYKGKIEKSRSEATRISTLYNKQQRLQRNTRSALSQLDRVIQKLNQDIQAFHSSSRALLRDYQDEYQDHVSEIVTAVQRTQQSAETLLACQAKVVHLEQALQDVSARHQLERQRRKVLHNSLVELKGNIRVHCRIRPLLPFDSESDDPVLQSSSISREVAHAVDDETVLVKCDRPGHPLINKTYHFERVYGPAESQRVVFGDVCPLLTSLLDGYNVCVMAYGQTGSGKSYTMLGPHSDDGPVLPLDPQSDLGIIPRTAEELFRLISENPSRSPKVEVSIVEVYNNDIFDLLAKDTVAAVSGVKREVMTAKDGRTEVALLASEAVGSASKLMELVRGGLQLRAKHPTLVHADSSRSHLIITVTLTTAACSDSTADQACSATLPREQTEAGRAGRSRRTSQGASAPQPVPGDPAGRAEQVQARLQLVDLAGSECIGVSGVTGSALRETACINRSLAALADVLGALSEHRSHVPYRNSRLTHLLQDCLEHPHECGWDLQLLADHQAEQASQRSSLRSGSHQVSQQALAVLIRLSPEATLGPKGPAPGNPGAGRNSRGQKGRGVSAPQWELLLPGGAGQPGPTADPTCELWGGAAEHVRPQSHQASHRAATSASWSLRFSFHPELSLHPLVLVAHHTPHEELCQGGRGHLGPASHLSSDLTQTQPPGFPTADSRTTWTLVSVVALPPPSSASLDDLLGL
ncbi:PREDICTED: kinesin-like protein KIF25 isoform X2 [Rhinopithecus bieti]|uniref:kinesin-like protein KIF25 isoform X2 n=1 Tax=Rhinopithecus bieti TaxID=61621 RepID=UPI00083C4332|nr:PREDICTED: kinesin-like protein KIF25 isoform X2 [Rhinopithecus bieti]